MSRLRATLAKSEIDRKVAERLYDAERAVISALEECDRHERKAEDRGVVLRTRKVSRDLRRVLATLGEVRRVAVLSEETEPTKQPSPVPAPIRTPV